MGRCNRRAGLTGTDMTTTPYDRQTSFTSYEAGNPTTPKRGTDLDAEFNAVKTALDNTQSNLELIQRADGKLANESVHGDAIGPDVIAAMAADVQDLISADLTAAQTAANNAANSATAAATSATNAANSASAAAGSATTAGAHAIDAAASAGAADAEASIATSAKLDAQAATDEAELWANAPPGTEVEPGLYSARHWAAQAASSVTGAMTYMGPWSAAGGTYPIPTGVGQLYRVSVAGTAGGIQYGAGDQIVWNGDSWDKIDNTEAVTSVAGKQGAVTLVAGDVGGLGALATRNDADWTAHISGKPSTFPSSTHNHPQSEVTGLDTALAAKAPLNAPTFTGQVSFSELAYATHGITVNSAIDGGGGAGIRMWGFTDTNWAMYVAQAGAGKSMSGGNAPASLSNRTGHHVRYRTTNAATTGHIWENHSEQCVMSLDADAGNLVTKGRQISATDTFVPTTAAVTYAGMRTSGSYGGGYVMVDGTQYSGMWSQADASGSILFGVGTSAGMSPIVRISVGAEERLVVNGRMWLQHVAPSSTPGTWYGNSANTKNWFFGVKDDASFGLFFATGGWSWQVLTDGRTAIRNANSSTLTAQPRTFVQSADPGAAATDGDLWAW
jgi:hypothetical protein